MGKLTPLARKVLLALTNRPLDVFDLSDEVRANPHRVFDACAALRARRLVDWMYPEDQVSIADAGRKALKEQAK